MTTPEQLTEQVRTRLNAIIDPCSQTAGAPAGLIDMGLVRESVMEPLQQGGYRARVKLSITHPFCLMAGVFLNEVEKRLRELPEVRELDVSMDTETLWTPQLMTQEYRVRLEAVRKARRIA